MKIHKQSLKIEIAGIALSITIDHEPLNGGNAS
jgi:hypothetical protein